MLFWQFCKSRLQFFLRILVRVNKIYVFEHVLLRSTQKALFYAAAVLIVVLNQKSQTFTFGKSHLKKRADETETESSCNDSFFWFRGGTFQVTEVI